MLAKSLQALGLETRPFTQEAFAEFVPAGDAAKLFERASDAMRKAGIALETSQLQISLRADLRNTIQFVVVGQHPQGRHGYFCLHHSSRSACLQPSPNWIPLNPGETI